MRIFALRLSLIATLILGCGGGGSPVTPGSAGSNGGHVGTHLWSVRVMSNSTLTTCTNYIDTVSPPMNVQGGTVSTDPCPAVTAVATCSGVDKNGNQYEQVFYSPPVTAAGLQTLMLECTSQGGVFSMNAYSPPWGADGGTGDASAAGTAGAGGNGAGGAGGSGGAAGIPPLKGVIQIATGADFVCALLMDHTVDCWGTLPGPPGLASPSPIPVLGLSGVTAIAAGHNLPFACALLDDGTVKCWGANSDGELGNGTMNSSSTPVLVSGVNGATAITLGYNVACALTPNGTYCWGVQTTIGHPPLSFGTSLVPVVETNLATATTIWTVLAEFMIGPPAVPHPCALFKDGSVQCDPEGTGVNPAVGLTGVTALSEGGHADACVLLSSGDVDCWGMIDVGQSSTATPAKAVSNATAMAAGGLPFVCAIMADTSVQCLGDGTQGELGNGRLGATGGPQFSSTPVVVKGLTGAIAIDAGFDFACALMADTTVQCWGAAGDAQLGHLDVYGSGATGTVVAPGSFCPALQALCPTLFLEKANCSAAYAKDAPDETACWEDLSLFEL